MPILINVLENQSTQLDTHYTTLMDKLNWFKCREMLVYHNFGYSDIEECERKIIELNKK